MSTPEASGGGSIPRSWRDSGPEIGAVPGSPAGPVTEPDRTWTAHARERRPHTAVSPAVAPPHALELPAAGDLRVGELLARRGPSGPGLLYRWTPPEDVLPLGKGRPA